MTMPNKSSNRPLSAFTEEDGAFLKDMVKAVESALNANDPEKAIVILKEHSKSIPREARRVIEPRVFDRAGWWESARDSFLQLVRDPCPDLALSDALAAADFFERSPDAGNIRDRMETILTDLYVILKNGKESDRMASLNPLRRISPSNSATS